MERFRVVPIMRPDGSLEAVMIEVPQDVYKEAFKNEKGNFNASNVKKGFGGLADAEGPRGGKGPYKLTIVLSKIEAQGGELVNSDADRVAETFQQLAEAQAYYKSKWFVVDGFDPRTFCPVEMGVPTYARFSGEALKRLEVLRERFSALSGKNAELATRSLKAAPKYEKDATPLGWRIARGLYVFYRNLFIGF
jgi:hypothetical protein